MHGAGGLHVKLYKNAKTQLKRLCNTINTTERTQSSEQYAKHPHYLLFNKTYSQNDFTSKYNGLRLESPGHA